MQVLKNRFSAIFRKKVYISLFACGKKPGKNALSAIELQPYPWLWVYLVRNPI
jgi:hypothetical protein